MNSSSPGALRIHSTTVATHSTSDSTVSPLNIHRPNRRIGRILPQRISFKKIAPHLHAGLLGT
jgi:hypothetical protein